ncbi:MAG: ribonuclease P protein component [Dissulfurimicrobium sp.]|uniref:ribonuclease P protein component n=1 Tax=Dissulfurimicrobium sp. TaxID=2022436 RepID=UPI00404A01FC
MYVQKCPDRKTRQTKNECLSRSERLCGKMAFNQVFKAQKRLKLPYMTIVYTSNSIASTRMGISIGKAYGNAVERNRTKRLIREFFRRNKDVFPAGLDMVFIPHKGFLRVDIKTFKEKLENLFNEIKDYN